MYEICGDIRLSFQARAVYLFLNFFRGIWGYRNWYSTLYWHPSHLQKGTESLSRKYINECLRFYIPKFISQKHIRVLDIGCGTGYIRKIMHELGYIVDYTGLDISQHQDFNHYAPYARNSYFIKAFVETAHVSEQFDVVISMQALEHIKDDVLAVQKGATYVKKGGVEIHTVPSFWSLFLYLWHGYRQYTPARLDKIFQKVNVHALRLGGVGSFLFHLIFVTVPHLFLRGRATGIRKSGAYKAFEHSAHAIDKVFPWMCSVYVVIRTH